jgi:CRP-like cAMP-binding protein
MSSDDTKKIRLVPGDGRVPSRMSAHDRLIRTLLTIGDLSEDDQEAIRQLPGRERQLDAYEDVVSDGDPPNSIAVIVDGFACRYKLLGDGRRQIMSFHIAGDAADLQSMYLKRMDHSVGTLAETTVMHIPHEAVLDLFRRMPNVATVFWQWTLVDASVFREWMTNLGQRDAYERMAHLLCEVMTRMRAVGLAQGQTCELPVTQSELADATGMSTVHVNRTLQTLRAHKLIQLKTGSLTILDWDGLKRAGDFDPTYLHFREQVA